MKYYGARSPVGATNKFPFFACCAVAIGGLVFALYWTARFSYASYVSRSSGIAGLTSATKLDPWHAPYRGRLAAALDIAGQDPEPELLAATRLDPMNSAWWNRRAIRAEMRGDNDSAERLYLEAARVSQLFGPRVALMNFYFRQGKTEKFWEWTRLALERSYGDLSGTFRLCWRVRPDAGWIVDHAFPDDAGVLERFLQFVTAEAGAVAAAPVADRLLTRMRPESRESRVTYCDRLIQEGAYAQAREVWQRLFAARPAHDLLENPSLAIPPAERGFDWHTSDCPGVKAIAGDPPGGFALTFPGKQPESCSVLWQLVSIPAAGDYRLALDYRTEGGRDAGLTWRVAGPLPTIVELAALPLAAASEWTRRQAWIAMPGPGFVRLTLQYQRAPGTVRFEGRLWIRGLRLEEVARGK